MLCWVTYQVKGEWYTAGPSVMSIAGAHRMARKLVREGYTQIRIRYC